MGVINICEGGLGHPLTFSFFSLKAISIEFAPFYIYVTLMSEITHQHLSNSIIKTRT